MARRYPKLHYHMVFDDLRQEVGNKISYMGTYRGDIIIPIHSVVRRLCLHLVFTGLRNGDNCLIQLLDPQNKTLMKTETGPIEVPMKPKPRYLVVDLVMGGMKISAEGSYRVLIEFGEDEKAKQDFKINFKKTK